VSAIFAFAVRSVLDILQPLTNAVWSVFYKLHDFVVVSVGVLFTQCEWAIAGSGRVCVYVCVCAVLTGFTAAKVECVCRVFCFVCCGQKVRYMRVCHVSRVVGCVLGAGWHTHVCCCALCFVGRAGYVRVFCVCVCVCFVFDLWARRASQECCVLSAVRFVLWARRAMQKFCVLCAVRCVLWARRAVQKICVLCAVRCVLWARRAAQEFCMLWARKAAQGCCLL